MVQKCSKGGPGEVLGGFGSLEGSRRAQNSENIRKPLVFVQADIQRFYDSVDLHKCITFLVDRGADEANALAVVLCQLYVPVCVIHLKTNCRTWRAHPWVVDGIAYCWCHCSHTHCPHSIRLYFSHSSAFFQRSWRMCPYYVVGR